MSNTTAVLAAVLLTGWLWKAGTTEAVEPDTQHRTVKQLMRAGFTRPETPGNKAMKGQATPAELQVLLKIAEDLSRQTPPKGSLSRWKSRTSELVSAVRDGVEQKDGAVKRIRAAIRCVDCHRDHRPAK